MDKTIDPILAIIIIIVLLLLLIFPAMQKSKCESAGGLYLKSWFWYECVKVEKNGK